MTAKSAALALAAAVCVLAATESQAAKWTGLDEDGWYSGPKLTAADLAGKVVLVDEWGYRCPPCKALLPQIQKYWKAFSGKGLVIIGSHRQGRAPEQVRELVKQNALTYPIYEGAGLAEGEPGNGGGIPFMYVVDHRGRVVYSGRSEREAIAAAQEALLAAALPPSLTGDIVFDRKSPYRGLDKQLVLGRNATAIVKRLENDAKRAGSKASTPGQKAAAAEAEKILAALEQAKKDVLADIEALSDSNPPKALEYARNYAKSFPAEAAQLKEKTAELAVKAKEWTAAQRAANRAAGRK